MNLVLCFKENPVDSYLVQQIQDAWPEVDIINVGQDDLPSALLEADYFFGHAKVPVDWDRIVSQGRLKWIQSSAAGMDWCLVPSVIDSNIIITTASGVLSNQVAEHTMALLLASKRNLPVFFGDQFGTDGNTGMETLYRKFKRRPTDDLTGLSVGIVGFGGVGRRLAQLLAPWKCRIVATDAYPIKKPDCLRELWPADRLDELLADSDIIVLSLPLNSSTKGLFDAEKFGIMKKGALFANMARGALVQTDALREALDSGHLSGAVLDVTDPEPVPPDHPLWDTPNLIITPHVAGQSHRRFDEVARISIENIRRWNSRHPMINYLTKEGKNLGFPIPGGGYPLWWECEQYGNGHNKMMDNIVRRLKSRSIGSPSEDYFLEPEDWNLHGTNLAETTTFIEGRLTKTQGREGRSSCSSELLGNYVQLISNQPIEWDEHLSLLRILGSGGQGVVYLSERKGSDDFILPVALKIFSPENFENDHHYDETMSQIARVSAHVARIQHDNLLDVHCWKSKNRIRIMEMEWVDGFDLGRLLRSDMLLHIEQRVSHRRWNYINEVIVTRGSSHPRVKPGVAIAIIRECLSALAALHREGIVHGDIKPSNIMLKRTGNAKIIDIGSAFEYENPPQRRTCTPAFAAPEVLDGAEVTPQSDLASLGYVLIEMLAGVSPFEGKNKVADLLEAKRFLGQRLHTVLPEEVVSSELLMSFCRGLIAPDPNKRFPSAEAADLVKDGAANFHRQLVKGDLASEYDNEIRLWLEELETFS